MKSSLLSCLDGDCRRDIIKAITASGDSYKGAQTALALSVSRLSGHLSERWPFQFGPKLTCSGVSGGG